MNNVTTFETAQRLKAAGFPQPEIKVGQFWYNPDRELAAITHIQPVGFVFIGSLREVWSITQDAESDAAFNSYFYAPTTTDILRELGHEWDIGYTKQNSDFPNTWMVLHEYKSIHFTHTNPAEAAALAYLSLHEKTE